MHPSILLTSLSAFVDGNQAMAVYLIEFVGGPFDGYGQQVCTAPDNLALHVALPVSPSIFRLLEGHLPARITPVTSVAFYRKDVWDGHVRYRFVASRSPRQSHIEG